jgi:hypothetical protein
MGRDRYTEKQIVGSEAIRRGLGVVQIFQEGGSLLACLRIDHTRLTHGHFVMRWPAPLYIYVHCGLPGTDTGTIIPVTGREGP